MRAKIFLLFLFCSQFLITFANDCDCPNHPGKISRKIIDIYPVIFQGFADSSSACANGKAKAFFTGIELYKGEKIPLHLSINFKCEGSCKMEFNPGEIWLIYANRDSLTKELSVEYCERSRRYYSKNTDDVHIMYNESTFKEETEYLKSILLPAYFIEESDLNKIEAEKLKVITQNRELEFASGEQKIWILLGSTVFIILLIFVVKRFLR